MFRPDLVNVAGDKFRLGAGRCLQLVCLGNEFSRDVETGTAARAQRFKR
jgi:hypothetical protein